MPTMLPDPDFTPVRVTEADLSALAEIERSCFSDPWSETALALLLDDPNVGYAVSMDGKIVGYGGMQCVLDEGQITDIAVLPEYRRRGIAAAILETLIDHAKREGLAVLYLEVRVSNTPAVALYRDRFGFEVIGVRRNFYSHPKEDAWNMRLFLS